MDEVRREVEQCLWPSVKQGGSFHGLGLQCLIASGFIFEHNNAIKACLDSNNTMENHQSWVGLPRVQNTKKQSSVGSS